MPIKIGSTTNIQQHFYNSLTSTTNNLGLSQLWLVGISQSDLQAINTINSTLLNRYEGDTHPWNIFTDAAKALETIWFIGGTYYILAESVTFPGDSLTVSRAGVDQTGALKGLIGEQRNDLSNITISFLETSQSIADLVFRPWMITWGLKVLNFKHYENLLN